MRYVSTPYLMCVEKPSFQNVQWKGLDGKWVNERFNALLESGPKPTVAAINGLCLGGGLEASMACNARVAAEGERRKYSEGISEIFYVFFFF